MHRVCKRCQEEFDDDTTVDATSLVADDVTAEAIAEFPNVDWDICGNCMTDDDDTSPEKAYCIECGNYVEVTDHCVVFLATNILALVSETTREQRAELGVLCGACTDAAVKRGRR